MASISLPTAALIAVGVGATATAYESHMQGVAASNQAKQKARVEAENATQQQIQMRQKMLRALASQSALAGGNGGGMGSSFGANVRRQLSEGQNDLLVSRAGASATASLLDQEARNARAAGDIGAIGDLAGGAGKIFGA